MAQVILDIISSGLPIIDKLIPSEATKIRNMILEYQRSWDEEISKGSNRDDARLDMLEYELLDIGRLFSETLKSAVSPSKP